MKKVELFGPSLLVILFSIAIMEICFFVFIGSMEIIDFKQAVEAHNNGHYTPHLLSDIRIDVDSKTLEKEVSVDTVWVSNSLMFAINLRHCSICDGRENNRSWLIRTIWPLFDIKQ